MSRKREKWYQKTESMLYNYPSFEIRIRSYMAIIEDAKNMLSADRFNFADTPSGMVSAYGLKEGSSYSVSSPVEKDVNHLMMRQTELETKYRRKIENLQRWKEIVETSIDIMLDPDQQQLVNLAYFKRLPWQQICQQLVLDKNTYFNERRNIVKVLAWCFGYLDDDEAREVLGLFAEEELWKRKATNH